MQGSMTYPPPTQADGDEEELQSETYVGVVAFEGFTGNHVHILPADSMLRLHPRCYKICSIRPLFVN